MSRAGWPARNARRSLAALVCAGSAVACSVLLDWEEFSDGTMSADASRGPSLEASAAGDGGVEAGPVSAALASCGIDKLCSPPVQGGSGWSGPFALFAGAPGSLPVTCDSTGYASAPAFSGSQGLSAPQARCSCTCGAPQGLSCAPPNVTFYSTSDTACGTAACDAAPLPIDGGCVAIPVGCTNYVIGSSTPTGGTCAVDGSVVLPPVEWSNAALACSPSQASAQDSCGSGELCLPARANAPFCIMHAGASPCPLGDAYYVAQHVYYEGVSDGRGCADCSCGAPSSGSCAFPTPPAPAGFPYLDTACATTFTGAFSVPESCFGIPTAKALRLGAAPTLNPGTCAPSAGSPTGDAEAAMPTTFCCTN